MEERSALEPTILEAVRQNWWVVAISAVGAALIGWALAVFVFNDARAVSAVLIEDPNVSNVFETGLRTPPERYLAVQVAILESPELAIAADRLVTLPQSDRLDLRQTLRSRRILSRADTDLIRIEFVHPQGEAAIAYANAYAQAYQEYRQVITRDSFERAIRELDNSIQVVDQELAEINATLEELAAFPGSDQMQGILAQAWTAFLLASGEAADEALSELVAQLQAAQLIQQLEAQSPNWLALTEVRTNELNRRNQMVTRRDQLRVNAELTSTGVIAASAATEAEPAVGAGRLVGFVGLLGLLAGAGLAYGIALRNRRFGHRMDPELALGVPMLAEVPEYDIAEVTDLMPVLYDRTSPAAESYRFAGSAIAARLDRLATERDTPANSVTFTSALIGEGKTVVAINTALSVAARGKAVLLIDADFGDQSLTRILIGEDATRPGITDIFSKPVAIGDVVVPVELTPGSRVDVLPRGTVDTAAIEFFNSAMTTELFQVLRTRYDYVFVDAPPLLQIAYAAAITKLTDAAVTVIPHNGLVSLQEEVLKRLQLVESDLLGYIYNKAPRRSEMQDRRGSMQDILGRGVPTTR